jgi:hypothetical protein
VTRGHEAAPLVIGSTMVIVTPYPNIVYALDLAKPGATVKWKFEPKPLAEAQGVACCDVVNRGAAYADGRVFFNTLDGTWFGAVHCRPAPLPLHASQGKRQTPTTTINQQTAPDSHGNHQTLAVLPRTAGDAGVRPPTEARVPERQ